MHTLVVFGLITIGLVNAAMGLMVGLGARRNATNISFVLLAFSIALWAFGLGLFLGTSHYDTAILAARTYYVAGILIAATALAFSHGFFYKGSHRRLMQQFAFIAITAIGMSVLTVYPDLMIGQLLLSSSGNEVVLNGYPYAVYLSFFLLYALGAMYILYRKYHQATAHRTREQLKLILYGYLLTGILGTIFNLIFPLVGNYRLIWVGPLFSVFLAVFIFRGIVAHKLFDIRLVLARTVAYVLLIVTMASMYSAAIFTASSLLFSDDAMSIRLNITYIVLAVILALSFQPLKRFFDRITDKIFFKNDYSLETVLDKLGVATAESIDAAVITNGALELLQVVIKPQFIQADIIQPDGTRLMFASGSHSKSRREIDALHDALSAVGDDVILAYELDGSKGAVKDALERADIDLVVRLNTAHESLGYLFFGEKQGGGVFRKKDLQLVNTAADEMALAIQNANRFQEIQSFSKTLQLNIRKATAELRASNLKLKKLDESKDDFISMASHQLRTPLTSIKGYISMVLDGDMGKVTPEQRKVLEEAFSSSQRMVYLISDFLNVSRLQTGKFELEMGAVDLPSLITDEIDQLQASAQSRNIKLVYEAPREFPMLTLDENKIRQVMMNFIDNAIYYAKPGGGTITVTLAKHAQYISFKVADNGIGVPKSEQHQLFSKFYRATNARKARPDGTGIGLFMAKKVIVAHGGAILFESVEGKGSMFGFRLPLEATTPAAPAQQSTR